MSTRRKLIDSVVTCISLLRLPSILQHFRRDEFCILMFHGITERCAAEQAGIGNTEDIHIHVNDFEAICQLLSRNYHVVSLGQAIDSLQDRQPLPDRSVVLTFDDGYLSNYEFAYPILKQYGLHGTIFIVTSFIQEQTWNWWDRLEYTLGHSKRDQILLDSSALRFSASLSTRQARREAFRKLLPLVKALNQEAVDAAIGDIEDRLGCSLGCCPNPPRMYLPLDWDQVREMAASDTISIGAHTHSHRILGRCKPDTAERELTLCRDLLADHAGVTNPVFSYPNGHLGDHTPETRQMIIDLGFRCALTTDL